MDRINKEILSEATRGHRISLSEWNAVVRAVKANTGTGNGFSDEGSSVSAPKSKYAAPSFTALNNTGATMPVFSVVGIQTASVIDDNLQLVLKKIGAVAVSSQLLLVTNGSIAIPDSRYATVNVIDFDSEYLVTCTDATHVPDIGMPCGVNPDTYTITKYRFGLVCVSLPDADNRVYVKRSQPISVVGCVTTEITKYDSATDVFGTGKVKIKYSNAANERSDAKNPYTGADWEQDVYNPFNKTFPVGTQIIATDTLGIGLIISDSNSNRICSDSGNESEPETDPIDAGPCCCNERDCVDDNGLDLDPTYLQFSAAAFQCFCNPPESISSLIKLYPTGDESIWESAAIQCRTVVADGPCENIATWIWRTPCENTGTWTWTLQSAACSNTATWTWTADTGCDGCDYEAHYGEYDPINQQYPVIWVLTGNGCPDACGACPPEPQGGGCAGPGYPCHEDCPSVGENWVLTSQTNAGCCTPDFPSAPGGPLGATTTTECSVADVYVWILTSETDADCACTLPYPSIVGEAVDDTTTTNCEVTTAFWELVSQTEVACCTPDAPDFDGTLSGDTTETSCDVAEGEPIYGDAIWRLTIGSIDYTGCDTTKLEFIVDGVVKYTYYLICPLGLRSRPFCLECTNTFRLNLCGKSDCETEPPTTICLKPVISYGVAASNVCVPDSAESLFNPGEVPRFMRVDIAIGTDETGGGECCSDSFNRSIVIEYDAHGTYPTSWTGFNPPVECCDNAIIRDLDFVKLRCTDAQVWELQLFTFKYTDGSCNGVPVGGPYDGNVLSYGAGIGNNPDILAGEPIIFPPQNTSPFLTCLGTVNITITPITPPT